MTKAAASGPQSGTFPLTGGLDLVTIPVSLTPGKVIAGVNYEPTAKGYTSIQGVERLDGQPKPSEASYSTINFDLGTANLTAGQIVTGGASGATGVMLADMVVTSGSFADGNAAGYVALGAITGAFIVNEHLKIGPTPHATTTSTASDRGAPDDDSDAAYLATAVLNARTLIQPVPGGGPVRGVALCRVDGFVYAFRDNAASGATKCPMWRASAAGWQAVPLGWTLKGTATSATAVAAGNTVTGATSGATGVVSRVITDGNQAWANGIATRLILSATTGAFQAGENLTVGGTALATAGGAATDNTPAPGGRFEFKNTNFYGATSLGALYGVNGVSPGFEWDGTIFTPIITGAPTETPEHLEAHKMHLALSYPNGQLQLSQSGLPQCWNGTFGAFADGIGDDITGLLSQLAGTLAIFSQTSINILSGSTAADFAMAPFTQDVGAAEWTLQTVGNPTYLDQGGVRNLTTTQAFGGFNVGTLTQLVQPYLDAKKQAKVPAVASLRVRNKSQYRLYFGDGTLLTIFVGTKVPSILPQDYGARIPRCTFSSLNVTDDEGTEEVLLMGCDDGYVYQIDKGTSMDGDEIQGFLRLAFNHCGSPNQNKRFQKMTLQVGTVSNLFFTAAFSDGDPDQPAVDEQSFSVYAGGGFWDESNWNNFIWSARTIGRADAHFDGLGVNCSPTIGFSSATDAPHTISTMTLLYSMRGPLR